MLTLRRKTKFDADGDPYCKRYITGDQVLVTDFDGRLGIGNFKYAILWCKVKRMYGISSQLGIHVLRLWNPVYVTS